MCEVHGRDKHGTAYGHTKVLGYHPLVAVRDDTGENPYAVGFNLSAVRWRFEMARLRRLNAEVNS